MYMYSCILLIYIHIFVLYIYLCFYVFYTQTCVYYICKCIDVDPALAAIDNQIQILQKRKATLIQILGKYYNIHIYIYILRHTVQHNIYIYIYIYIQALFRHSSGGCEKTK